LALLENGKLQAWGLGDKGQLGLGGRTSQPYPKTLQGYFPPFQAPRGLSLRGQGFKMRVESHRRLSLHYTPRVACEGGRCSPTRSMLKEVHVSSPWSGIGILNLLFVCRITNGFTMAAAGRHHSLGVAGAVGALHVWGSNEYGQVASSNTFTEILTPNPTMPEQTAILFVEAGWFHSFAIQM
jgi:alpha-tubulin suppressor-like RCC1 family protein